MVPWQAGKPFRTLVDSMPGPPAYGVDCRHQTRGAKQSCARLFGVANNWHRWAIDKILGESSRPSRTRTLRKLQCSGSIAHSTDNHDKPWLSNQVSAAEESAKT